MMTRDWEAEFEELNERERRAFAKLGQALYKLGSNTPGAVIDEMEQANTEWRGAKAAMAEFVAAFRSRRE